MITDIDTPATVSDRISLKMFEKKLKQTNVAEAIGSSKGTVSKWIAGTNVPRNEYLIRLARLLDTSPEWILNGEYPIVMNTSDVDDATNYINAMREENRDHLVKYLGLNPNIKYDVDYLDSLSQKETLDAYNKLNNDISHLKDIEDLIDDNTDSSKRYFSAPIYTEGSTISKESLIDTKDKIRLACEIALIAGASIKDTFCFYQSNDCMSPKIMEGSQCLADKSKTEIKDGKMYIFEQGVLLRMRYIYKRPDGGLLIRCENKKYDDEIISSENISDINIIGWIYKYTNIEKW